MNKAMFSLKNRQWFNNSLPQMLQIAVFLLYWGAFWSVISFFDALNPPPGAEDRPLWLLALLLALIPLQILGGVGLAEGRKQGYQLAVAAAFAPFAVRALTVIFDGDGLIGAFRYVLLGGSFINFMFEAALLALILHPKSRDHAKVWFR